MKQGPRHLVPVPGLSRGPGQLSRCDSRQDSRSRGPAPPRGPEAAAEPASHGAPGGAVSSRAHACAAASALGPWPPREVREMLGGGSRQPDGDGSRLPGRSRQRLHPAGSPGPAGERGGPEKSRAGFVWPRVPSLPIRPSLRPSCTASARRRGPHTPPGDVGGGRVASEGLLPHRWRGGREPPSPCPDAGSGETAVRMGGRQEGRKRPEGPCLSCRLDRVWVSLGCHWLSGAEGHAQPDLCLGWPRAPAGWGGGAPRGLPRRPPPRRATGRPRVLVSSLLSGATSETHKVSSSVCGSRGLTRGSGGQGLSDSLCRSYGLVGDHRSPTSHPGQ